MKVLFFIPPWEVNENYFYYENSLKNHLIPQANFLSKNAVALVPISVVNVEY